MPVARLFWQKCLQTVPNVLRGRMHNLFHIPSWEPLPQRAMFFPLKGVGKKNPPFCSLIFIKMTTPLIAPILFLFIPSPHASFTPFTPPCTHKIFTSFHTWTGPPSKAIISLPNFFFQCFQLPDPFAFWSHLTPEDSSSGWVPLSDKPIPTPGYQILLEKNVGLHQFTISDQWASMRQHKFPVSLDTLQTFPAPSWVGSS